MQQLFILSLFSDVKTKAAVVADPREMTMTERSQSFSQTFMESEMCHFFKLLFTEAVTSSGYCITAQEVTCGRRASVLSNSFMEKSLIKNLR